MHGVNDVRHTEIHTTEIRVPEPSSYEFEVPLEKIKSHRSPGTDQIPAELVKTGRSTIRPDVSKLINSTWNKEKLPDGWKQSINVPIYKKGDKTL